MERPDEDRPEIRATPISGPLIRAYRERLGESRPAFEDRTDIKVEQLRNVETGRRGFGEESLGKLSLELGVDGFYELMHTIRANRYITDALAHRAPLESAWAMPVERDAARWLITALSAKKVPVRFVGIDLGEIDFLSEHERRSVIEWLGDGADELAGITDVRAVYFRSFAWYILNRIGEPDMYQFARIALEQAIALPRQGRLGAHFYEQRSHAVSAAFGGDRAPLEDLMVPLLRDTLDLKAANRAILSHWYRQRRTQEHSKVWRPTPLSKDQVLGLTGGLIVDLAEERELWALNVQSLADSLTTMGSALRGSRLLVALPDALRPVEESPRISSGTRRDLDRIRNYLASAA